MFRNPYSCTVKEVIDIKRIKQQVSACSMQRGVFYRYSKNFKRRLIHEKVPNTLFCSDGFGTF